MDILDNSNLRGQSIPHLTYPGSDVADINPVLAGQFDRDLNLWAFCSQFI